MYLLANSHKIKTALVMTTMKKAVIIPHHLFEKMQMALHPNRENTDEIRDLNGLENIVNSNVDVDEKALLYQQELFKLLNNVREKKKDIEIPIVSVAPQNTNTPQVSSSQSLQPIEQTLQDILLPTQRRNGMVLYRIIKGRCHDITWDDNGVISILGSELQGSNIIDTIINLLSQRKQSLVQPVGFKALIPFLIKANIPQHLILNKERLRNLQSFQTPSISQILSATLPSTHKSQGKEINRLQKNRHRVRPYSTPKSVKRWLKF